MRDATRPGQADLASAVTEADTQESQGSVLVWVVATGTVGLGLLALRLVTPEGPVASPVSLGLLYAALLAVSVTAPVPPAGERLLHPAVVLAVGVAAFGFVAFAGRGTPAGSVTAVSIVLNSGAAVAEEAFFRRFAYGWLERIGTLVAWVGSALAFALMHVPFYGTGSFWVNLGAGFMLSWQRWASGGWAAPAATHVVANQLAVIRSPVG
jgi:Type II CAAX prenyl endopeptidase Rce1-like